MVLEVTHVEFSCKLSFWAVSFAILIIFAGFLRLYVLLATNFLLHIIKISCQFDSVFGVGHFKFYTGSFNMLVIYWLYYCINWCYHVICIILTYLKRGLLPINCFKLLQFQSQGLLTDYQFVWVCVIMNGIWDQNVAKEFCRNMHSFI